MEPQQKFDITRERIKKELLAKKLEKNEGAADSSVDFSLLVDDKYTELKGEITGPHGTPYEGGKFILHIDVGNDYPFNPPKLRFITKIWHPNVNSATGHISLYEDNWGAAMRLSGVLIDVQALMRAAEPNYSQDIVVTDQYKEELNMFERTARHWAQAYAGAPGTTPEFEEKIEKLMHLGIDENHAREILSNSSWNLDKAADLVLRTLSAPKDGQVALINNQSHQEMVNPISSQHAGDAKPPVAVPSNMFNIKIKWLMDRGVDEAKAREALSCCFWNLEKAAKLLFKTSSESGISQDTALDQQSREVPDNMPKLTPTICAQDSTRVPRPPSVFEVKIKALMDRGTDEAMARDALSKCYWNLQKASEMLFGKSLST